MIALRRIVVTFCFCWIVVSTPLLADDSTGAISGFLYGAGVQGNHRTRLAHATVFLFSWDHSAAESRRITDNSGFFAFLGVLPGRYWLGADAKAYRLWCPPRVVVIPGKLSRVNIETTLVTENGLKVLDVLCYYKPWADQSMVFW